MSRPIRLIRVLGAVFLGSAALAAAQEPAGSGPEALEATRSTLARWMETQQVISKEKKDWETARGLLEQRISLLEGEIASVESRIAEVRSSITDLDRKRRAMVDENRDLKEASKALVSSIASLEGRTVNFLEALPEPVLERVAPLARRIPRDPSKTDLSLGERFQNVIGVLNEVNKSNRDITVASELRSLPGGESAEVKVLYLGLGQAYFVSPNGDIAGVGRPSEDGWDWIQANELSGRIARAIAIIQNEQVPAFVPLPVEIR